jgi:hypothetical protein
MISDREGKRSISFPVIRVMQPIGEFYIGAVEAGVLYFAPGTSGETELFRRLVADAQVDAG